MMKTILHVGCGEQSLPDWLDGQEVRLDIDPNVSPDIIAPMTDLGDIGQFDAVYTSHALEHLASHEVKKCLSEFKRVVRDGGAVIIIVPDLEDIKPTLDVIYDSPAGPVTGLDMYYGKADMVEANPYMAHKTGFVTETLTKTMQDAGFEVKHCIRNHHSLVAVWIV
jgi:ubiquinone/menaquinone biosynthesis C-methylase UbiE